MTSYPSQLQQNSAASMNSAGIVKIKYLRIINQFNYNLPRLESVGFQKNPFLMHIYTIKATYIPNLN